MKHRILLVEDELSLQKSLSYILTVNGFEVLCTGSGEEAVDLARKNLPDLILLDLVLPGMDGFKVCEILNKNNLTEKIFVIMLTGRRMVDEIVKGLELYADDYITKPFEPRILLARINAILRRRAKSPLEEKSLLKFGALSIDLQGYTASVSGEDLGLTKTEFDILALVAKYPNQVFSRARILEQVREDNYPITERVVDYQVTGLRKKLGDLSEFIVTVRGVGYKFNPQTAESD